MSDQRTEVLDFATRAKRASRDLAPLTRAAKDVALLAMASALEAQSAKIIAATPMTPAILINSISSNPGIIPVLYTAVWYNGCTISERLRRDYD